MEVMPYVAEEDRTPDFPALLWRFMQSSGRKISYKEFAALLTKAGFKATENNISQWMNGDRTPPPGLPYYATLALGLEEEEGQELAWSYTRSYKDNRKGAGKSGLKEAPNFSGNPTGRLNNENVAKISAKREQYRERNQVVRGEGQQESDPGDRTL